MQQLRQEKKLFIYQEFCSNLNVPRPVKLVLYNQSAIKVCKNPERHEMMKHVQLKFHWIRESVLTFWKLFYRVCEQQTSVGRYYVIGTLCGIITRV
jgi:hypothetical protein